MVACTLLAKVGIPPLAAKGIGLIFPIIFACLSIAIVLGRASVDPRRLVFLLVVFALLGLIQLLRGDPFSLGSMIFMAAICTTYVFCIRWREGSRERALEFFGNLSLFIAVCGIAQFITQFFFDNRIAFPIESYLPHAFLTQSFNNMTPLAWGSGIWKSNGVFMLEPSVFSQLCSLGLVAELGRKQMNLSTRPLRLLVYALALLLSYSGTGLIILGVCFPLYVVMYRRWDLLVFSCVLGAVLYFAAEPLNISVFTNRASEFQTTESSGYMRFVAWMPMFDHLLWSDPARAMLGYGAGTFAAAAVPFNAAEMAYSKIFFEFGIVGAALYFSFLFYCIFTSPVPLIMRCAIAVFYFMNGAYSPTVTGVALSVLMLWRTPQPLFHSRTVASPQWAAAS